MREIRNSSSIEMYFFLFSYFIYLFLFRELTSTGFSQVHTEDISKNVNYLIKRTLLDLIKRRCSVVKIKKKMYFTTL